MPKMKTHRGAKKRFKVTGTGKVMHRRANRNHILEKKTTKRKRQLRSDGAVAASDVPRAKRQLGL